MCQGGERNMTLLTESSCSCNITTSSIKPSGVIVNNIEGLGSNLTCQGRGSRTYFISCISGNGLESSSSELVIVLLGVCLLLTLVSMSLYYKMKKDKKYYQRKLQSFEKNDDGSGSNERKSTN